MRKECERRRSREIGIVDKVKDLGAMVDSIALKLFCRIVNCEGFNSVSIGSILVLLLVEKQSQGIAKVR